MQSQLEWQNAVQIILLETLVFDNIKMILGS
jgi:hypothetical protein